MLQIHHEGPSWKNAPPEHCIFCKTPTRYWHKSTNNPVCCKCSKKYSEEDIPEEYIPEGG